MLPRLLYVTDLHYQARGRVYRDEDLWLSARLADDHRLALCDQPSAEALMGGFDGVVVRNSGPAIRHQAAYDRFRAAAVAAGMPVYNQLTGRADMVGKQYLVDLSHDGAAVIPTVDAPGHLHRLPTADTYLVKPKLGSDSIGLRTLRRDELFDPVTAAQLLDGSVLAQPLVSFVHEASFVFVDREFHYAVHAPDPERRWELVPFAPSVADLRFAQWFIDWNTIDHGIQRVDACRTADGGLLLMELEDHNPYLSLDLLDDVTRDRFVAAMRAGVRRVLQR